MYIVWGHSPATYSVSLFNATIRFNSTIQFNMTKSIRRSHGHARTAAPSFGGAKLVRRTTLSTLVFDSSENYSKF